MKKFTKILALVLAFAMLMAACLPLTSCGKDECTEHVDADGNKKCDNCNADVDDGNGGGGGVTPTPDGKATYTVKVKSVGGYALEGVFVNVIDSATGSLVDYEETDAEGMATFTLPVKTTYVAELEELPDGYVARDEYAFAATGSTVITLASEILEDTGLTPGMYKPGMIMHDFTLSDPEGNVYNLKQLFADGKKAVVLNFWYTTCSWCIKEFPSLQAAYENNKDDIALLAINDYATDTAQMVKDFGKQFPTYGAGYPELTFPMMKDTAGLFKSFGFTGNPSTVIIDRYGMITICEEGAVIGEGYWNKAFAHFASEDYVQNTYESIYELSPQQTPTGTMPPSEEIADAFNQGEVNVTYSPETDPEDAEFSWPFEIVEFDKKGFDKVTCIRPTNAGIDNSYAILYANVTLEAGEAVVFDYFSSSHNDEINGYYDVMYVLVDGKDVYSIAGVERDGWKSCCAFVAEKAGTYEVAFCYTKDSSDSAGDDTVYLDNFRVIPKEELDLKEVFVYREASNTLKPDGTGYENYVDVVLGADGYYHVGTADGPILLADLLGYTNFDSSNSVTTILYAPEKNYEFLVNGVNKFNAFELHCNYASNSQIYGYASVNEELASLLKEFVKQYALAAGKIPGENTWLELCVYYDSYGTDGKQLADPIKGLAYFNAFDVVETTDINNPQRNEVTYNRVIMPRGYLYKFVPTVSGVYRVVTNSKQEVDGWIFSGNTAEWTASNRIVYASSTDGERLNPDLIKEDTDGDMSRDLTNCSMVAYMEAGVEYYISIAFYETAATGSFTFTVRKNGDENGNGFESFDYFIEASPGYFTYELGANGGVGNMLAGGIDVVLGNDGYYYHKIITNKETGEWKYGSAVYADFFWPTNPFPQNSIEEFINKYAFDFSKTAEDLEAIAYYNTYAKLGFSDYWREQEGFEERWNNEYKAQAELKEDEWLVEFERDWLLTNGDRFHLFTEEELEQYKAIAWEDYYDDKLESEKEALWEAEFDALWAKNPDLQQIADDIYLGISHTGALAEQYHTFAREGLEKLWGQDFEAEWRFYEFDDLLDGVFHGTGKDYTAAIKGYLDDMLDEEGFPERQGCVQVDEELAEILQMLMDKYTFRNVENSWTKLCYYYKHLGPAAE